VSENLNGRGKDFSMRRTFADKIIDRSLREFAKTFFSYPLILLCHTNEAQLVDRQVIV